MDHITPKEAKRITSRFVELQKILAPNAPETPFHSHAKWELSTLEHQLPLPFTSHPEPSSTKPKVIDLLPHEYTQTSPTQHSPTPPTQKTTQNHARPTRTSGKKWAFVAGTVVLGAALGYAAFRLASRNNEPPEVDTVMR